MAKNKTQKYNTKICDDKMSFNECELAILRNEIDKNEKLNVNKLANSEDVKKMISILENFLIRKKLVCYGGTAINNILPVYAQFYNRDVDIPDYDFFSPNALDDAKELADIYFKEGYTDVEAKSGTHMGTFKVFVNFIPMADITYLDTKIYSEIYKDSISIAGIHYAPPNYLRMAMYLELSRPHGDISRWEKVFKRLTILNEHFPLDPSIDCNKIDFQRKLDVEHDEYAEKLYLLVRDSFIEQGAVFFGGYATSLYSNYMPKERVHIVKKIPDFEVIIEDIDKSAMIVKERLASYGFKNVTSIIHDAIGELIPRHIEIRVGDETIAFIYQVLACHNYNTIVINKKQIKVATLDTMLNLYLAFIYTGNKYYAKDQILCMSKFLFDVEEANRLDQTGLLKRFGNDCVGHQHTLEEIRAEKAQMFKKLGTQQNTKEYEMWFLKYNPAMKNQPKRFEVNNTRKAKYKDNGENSQYQIAEKKQQKYGNPQKYKKFQKYRKYQKSKKQQYRNSFLY
jgi:hypothetical protein